MCPIWFSYQDIKSYIQQVFGRFPQGNFGEMNLPVICTLSVVYNIRLFHCWL